MRSSLGGDKMLNGDGSTRLRVAALLVTMAGLWVCTSSSWAGTKLMNVQGKLTDNSGTALSGTYAVTFRLYNSLSAPTSSNIWADSLAINVSSGLFNVTLGTSSSLDNLPFNSAYY